MKVPTVGSVVKIRTRYMQGPSMIPPLPNFVEYQGKVLPKYKWLTDREFCLTGTDEWPIRVINMEYVQDLELISGDLKEISTDVEVFEVPGSKGNKYIVTRNKSGWNCTCPGFQFRRQCKHVSELSAK